MLGASNYVFSGNMFEDFGHIFFFPGLKMCFSGRFWESGSQIMIPPEKKKSGQRKNDHVPYFEYGGCEGNFRTWQFALGESL